MIMVGSHDNVLVALSVLIAAFASYTALSLAPRIRSSQGSARRVWLAAAALALGGGIWSMHFVAMLAFSMPGMAMSYDLGLTLASFALAVIFTGAGFVVMSLAAVSLQRTIAAGLLMGSGVVAMHYVGMSAMRMEASLSYERLWLSVSVLIAIGAATAAVWLASQDHKASHRLAASLVMGAAIAGMHYAGMRAAVFTAAEHVDLAEGVASVTQTYLAAAISAVTFLILVLALGAARLDRAFQGYTRREARIALRLRIADVLREQDTGSALETVASLMGEHFGVSRTGYGQLEPVEDLFEYDVCWTDGTVPPLLGRFPAADFGVKIVAELNAGRTVVVEDLLLADISNESRTRNTAREVDTRSILVVPFVRDGRLKTIVYLNDRHPRSWHPDDVHFMEELAERTRLVIERAAVEDQLRELNANLEARVEARTAELRSAEEARRATDALYRAFFENTPEPLFIAGVEPDGTFTAQEINPAHEANVGFKLEEIRGRSMDEILPPAAADTVIAAFRRVVETGEVYQYQEVFELSRGRQHWDTSIVPLRDSDGQIVRLLGTTRDITRQVSAEEALRQSQKMEAIGSLTGGVAHDFNNLLTPIMGALDLLQRKGVGGEREQRLIGAALTSAEKAKALVQRLLAFARRQPLNIAVVDIPRLIEGMAELVRSTVGPKIVVETYAPADLPAAQADPNQLEMALLNLSVNARDAMPDGGTVRLEAVAEHLRVDNPAKLPPGGYLRISVSDTGFGMDERTRERAIEPFFSTKGVGKGTGLGLSMAHGLAAQLGGTLTIESQVGAGTTVTMWIPQSFETRNEELPATAVPVGASSLGSALLVDDEEPVRAATAAMLRDLGYSVTEASSSEEALRLFEGGLDVDLVITDHLMPGMNGAELVRELLCQRPGLPTLLISGYAETQTIDADIHLLTKPFRLAELAAKVDAVVGQSVPT